MAKTIIANKWATHYKNVSAAFDDLRAAGHMAVSNEDRANGFVNKLKVLASFEGSLSPKDDPLPVVTRLRKSAKK